MFHNFAYSSLTAANEVSGFRFQVSGFRFQVSSFKFQVSGFTKLLSLKTCNLRVNPAGINRKGDRVGTKNFFIDSTLEEIIYICRLK